VRTILLFAVLAGLSAACANSGHTPKVYPGPPAAPHPPVVEPANPPSPPAGAEVAAFALSLVGSPYREGGAGPDDFDCSGFVQYVFGKAGISLARGVSGQFGAGVDVEKDALREGDLVFFAIDHLHVSHVAIVVGPDTFVHAPSSRGTARVRVDHLSADFWRTRFAGGRRVLP
jgi:cell wall-associated NlpC family hydrolase